MDRILTRKRVLHMTVERAGKGGHATYPAGVVRLERAAFGADAWPSELFQEYARICPDLFLIARVNSRIVGYSITCVEHDRAELVSIAVSRRYRGRGIATALLRRTLLRLKAVGAADFRLTVRAENQGAIRLYQALGFVRSRRAPGYYEDGADGWRMRLQI